MKRRDCPRLRKPKRCIIYSIRGFFKLIRLLFIVSVSILIASLFYLAGKAWTRNGRAPANEKVLVRIIKWPFAFMIIILMKTSMIFVVPLSSLSKRLSLCRKRAKREGRRLKNLLSTVGDVVLILLNYFFSAIYDLSWFMWGMLDGE